MHIIPWDFVIQTDHRIQVRRSDQVSIKIEKKEKDLPWSGLTVPADDRLKNERIWKAG